MAKMMTHRAATDTLCIISIPSDLSESRLQEFTHLHTLRQTLAPQLMSDAENEHNRVHQLFCNEIMREMNVCASRALLRADSNKCSQINGNFTSSLNRCMRMKLPC